VNLGDIRKAVRDRVELDDTDLPNDILDPFIQEGYDRVIQLETRWPFFETLWTLPMAATDTLFTLPPEVADLASIRTATNRLVKVQFRDGEDFYSFAPTTGEPCHWAKLGRDIYVWPPPSATATMTLRGWRYPTDWIAAGATAAVDADERLHRPIVNFALSVVYAQQEDEVLSGVYLSMFERGAGLARDAVMRAWTDETLILGQGRLHRDQSRQFVGNLALITPGDVDGGGP